MRKEHTRDYAVAAFRFYAQSGKSSEKYVNQLINELIHRYKSVGVADPTATALVYKDEILRKNESCIVDLKAVEVALSVLDRQSSVYRRVIEMVYFERHWEPLEWGDIGTRVRYASINIPASESQIYLWLKRARNEFSVARGLRI